MTRITTRLLFLEETAKDLLSVFQLLFFLIKEEIS